MTRQRTTICLLTTGIAALASGACSLLFPASTAQCASDDDCRARGPSFVAAVCSQESLCVTPAPALFGDASTSADSGVDPFACAALPAASPDPSRKLELTIKYVDFASGAPPTGTVVRLCAATDSNCANARSGLEGSGPGTAGPDAGAGWVMPRADGTVSTIIEFGFEGFFEARAPQYPPFFRSTSPALRNPKTEIEQLLLRTNEIEFLADQALRKAGAYDSVGHGLVFVYAQDCEQRPLAGASFTTTAVDEQMRLFYIINSSPSVEDTKTDSLGRGGFINIPAGIHTFTGWLGEGESRKRYGSGRVLVRVGSATVLVVSPSP